MIIFKLILIICQLYYAEVVDDKHILKNYSNKYYLNVKKLLDNYGTQFAEKNYKNITLRNGKDILKQSTILFQKQYIADALSNANAEIVSLTRAILDLKTTFLGLLNMREKKFTSYLYSLVSIRPINNKDQTDRKLLSKLTTYWDKSIKSYKFVLEFSNEYRQKISVIVTTPMCIDCKERTYINKLAKLLVKPIDLTKTKLEKHNRIYFNAIKYDEIYIDGGLFLNSPHEYTYAIQNNMYSSYVKFQSFYLSNPKTEDELKYHFTPVFNLHKQNVGKLIGHSEIAIESTTKFGVNDIIAYLGPNSTFTPNQIMWLSEAIFNGFSPIIIKDNPNLDIDKIKTAMYLVYWSAVQIKIMAKQVSNRFYNYYKPDVDEFVGEIRKIKNLTEIIPDENTTRLLVESGLLCSNNLDIIKKKFDVSMLIQTMNKCKTMFSQAKFTKPQIFVNPRLILPYILDISQYNSTESALKVIHNSLVTHCSTPLMHTSLFIPNILPKDYSKNKLFKISQIKDNLRIPEKYKPTAINKNTNAFIYLSNFSNFNYVNGKINLNYANIDEQINTLGPKFNYIRNKTAQTYALTANAAHLRYQLMDAAADIFNALIGVKMRTGHWSLGKNKEENLAVITDVHKLLTKKIKNSKIALAETIFKSITEVVRLDKQKFMK